MGVMDGVAEWKLQEQDMPDLSLVRIAVLCLVDHEDRERQRYHTFHVAPSELGAVIDHWRHKYPEREGWRNHQFLPTLREIPKGFDDRLYSEVGEAPWWLERLGYHHNTNFTYTYRASAAITNAIASLATSSTLLAGYESATIDNSSNKDIDIFVSALVTVGTTPTANTQIEIHSVSMRDDATWPDVFDGTTSAETITNAGVKDGICNPLGFLNCSAATSNVGYEMTKQSLAARYGGICPDKSGLFTVHNTAVNLHATGTNHSFASQGIYLTGT